MRTKPDVRQRLWFYGFAPWFAGWVEPAKPFMPSAEIDGYRCALPILRAARCDEFPELFQRDLRCPVPFAKRFRLTRRANQNYKPRRPVPEEGRWPSSRTLGRDAVDAAASGARWDRRAGFACERSKRADERCCYPGFEKAAAEVHNPAKPLGENGSRTAKPCGPDTRCWCQIGGGFASPTGPAQNR
jgi:hypothetical protein